jgi:hypothetical protein
MRRSLLVILLMVEALAHGQGFNRKYDAFGQGFAQGGFNVELLLDGYLSISTGADLDSIGPDLWLSHYSVLLTRIDADGERLWEKRSYRPFHGTTAGWSNCCDTIPGGGYVVGGASEDTTGFDEVYLMRFDAEGDTLWTKVFGDPNENKFWIGSQVKRTANGDFLIVGITDQNGPFNAFLIRTDSNGNELWRRVYAYATGIDGGLGAIGLAENGDIFTSGTVAFSSTNSDRWVQRHTPDGTVQWQVAWGGIWREGSAHLTVLDDGQLLVSGGVGYATNLTMMRPYLAKLNSADGSIIWEREYGPTAYGTQFFPAKETPTGDLIAAGVSYANATTDQQGLLCRTTSAGDSIWMYNYFYQDEVMSDGTGRFYDVLPTADGGFIAAGATYFSASGNNPQGISQDTWVVKVDADGCIIPGCNTVGITEQATNLLDALRIWPNPAQGQCTVQLDLPASIGTGALLLTVVAADGRVAQQHSIAGNGTHPLDLQGLSAGMYHVHVSQGGRWLTGGKVVVE